MNCLTNCNTSTISTQRTSRQRFDRPFFVAGISTVLILSCLNGYIVSPFWFGALFGAGQGSLVWAVWAAILARALPVVDRPRGSEAQQTSLVALTKVVAKSGSVIWFTGLPSSGKTTLSLLLKAQLEAAGHDVEHLDGDAVRAILPGIGFSKEERNNHIRRMGFVASRLEAHGVTVICSFVSPYRESRDFVRSLCSNFFEIFLSTDVEECSRRDVKGLYQENKDGARKGMTGVDDPYEPPAAAELTLNTAIESKEQCVQAIVDLISSQSGNCCDRGVAPKLGEMSDGSHIAA